jgi:hypothetical protein
MIEEVVIRMGMDARPVSAALRGVRKDFADFKQQLGKLNPLSILQSAGGAIGIGLSFAALGAAAKSSMDFAKEIKHLREETDISAETLQAWSLRVSKTGGDAESAKTAIEKLVIKIGQARSGSSEAADVFAKLGVSLSDSTGHARDNESIFKDIVTRLGAIEDPALRNAEAFEVFSRAGVKVTNALKGGAKGLEDFKKAASGKILSDADVDRLTLLGKITSGVGGRFTALIGKATSIASTFFLGDAKTDLMISRLTAARKTGDADPEIKAENAKKVAEELARLAKIRRENNMMFMSDTMKLGIMKREEAELTEKIHDTEKDSLEQVTLKVERAEKEKEILEITEKIAKAKKESDKEAAEHLEKAVKFREKELETLHSINRAAQSRADAVSDLATTKGDRSRFTLQELADLPVNLRFDRLGGFMGGNVTGDMANQILTARNIEQMEARARRLAESGNFDGSQDLLSRADKLRSGLTALTDKDRFPFKSLEKSVAEQTDTLKELLRKAKEEGINIIPANG